MRRLLAIALLTLVPTVALPQDTSSEEDKGFLTNWLETTLSGAGRDIQIDGFQGALSSTASLDRLTIADDEGIWITLKDVKLSWDRGALLGGALEVTELSAGSIDLIRWPATEESAPSPEATEFQLPELPVSVRVQEISAASVTLGEAILGDSATVSLNGNVQLIEGEAAAGISILRIDEQEGSLSLEAGYSNATKVLDLSLTIEESRDGILVNLLNIPDRPSVNLQAKGTGPTTDFSADIALATDSAPRVTGSVRLTGEVDADGARTNLFQADLQGDIAPLLVEQHREFFGGSSELRLAGAVLPDKRLNIEEFKVASAALDLSGALSLSGDGLPVEFDVKGSITAVDGADVVLPIGGSETRISSALLTASFKAGTSDEWTLDANFLDLTRESITIGDGAISASGLIQRIGEGEPKARRVTAKVDAELFAMKLAEGALGQAIGDSMKGSATLDWQDGGPVRIGFLDISSGDVSVGGSGTLDGFESDFRIDADVTATAGNLGRFSALAGQPLAGAAKLAVAGWFEPLGGAFDGTAIAETTALRVGNSPYLDLVAGDGSFNVKARRGTDGLVIDKFTLQTALLDAKLDGQVKTEASDLRASLALADVSSLVEGLSGPARLAGTARQDGPEWVVDVEGTGPGDLSLAVSGTVGDAGSNYRVTADIEAAAGLLEPFSALARQPLAGAAEIVAAGWYEPLGGAFDGAAKGTTTGFRVGSGPLLGLVAGDGSFKLKARGGTEGFVIDEMALQTALLEAALDGQIKSEASELGASLALADVASLVKGISGPARLSGTARQDGPDWMVDVDGTGPGGSSIDLGGTVAGTLGSVALDLTGSVPIGLANNFLSASTDVQGQANLNLSINGPPSLNAVTGTITTSGARVSAPVFRVALRRIDATATLAGSVASIDLGGEFNTGGQATVDGSISLAAPFAADLRIGLRNAEFTDPPVYQTTASGELTLQGPLAGGASLGGRIELDETEIRLAPTTTTQGIPDITHVNDRRSVSATRSRAGLNAAAAANGDGSRPARALAIDIVINAPSRIFVRGRGLDTELGGRLRLTGTTRTVIPIGQFNLVRGRLDILGKRLEMLEGQLQLQGSFDPRFRMVASTETSNATVRIITEGTPQSPSITFESDPDLPDDEILANLLFGKSIASISPLQAAQLAAAVATLAGSGGDGVIGKIRGQFNLDDLDITTDDQGTAAFRAGKYLSENVYTDVEVSTEGRSQINLNLDLTPNITAKGTVGSDGDTGLGIFYELDY